MTLTVALLLAAGGAMPALQARTPTPPRPPALSIRPDRSVPYRPGDSVRAAVHVSPGRYLTVLRVDTEGRIRVLYPTHPDAGGFVAANTAHTLPTTRLAPFRAGPRPGVGYLAAFVSRQPFDYRSIVHDGRWDDSPAARARIVGDPVAGLLAFMRPLATTVTFDLAEYKVGGDFGHPRFACTGCHAADPEWDPYAGRCRVVTTSWTTAVQRAVTDSWSTQSVAAVPRLVYRPVGTGPGAALTPDRWSGLRAIDQLDAPAPGTTHTRMHPMVGTGRPQLLRRREGERLPAGPAGETPP